MSQSNLNNFFNSLNYSKSIEIFKSIIKNGVILFGASGEMGSKISSTFARASVPVIMQDIDESKLIESKNNALSTLEKAFSKRKLSKKQLEIIKNNKLINDIVIFPERGKIPFGEIQNSQDAKDFLNKAIPEIKDKYSSSYMLLEAGPENILFKQDIFNFFSLTLNDPNAILATNTSSLKIDEIASKVSNPERVAGFHYFLPAHTNALVEIISGSKTSPEVIFALQNLAVSMGKKPIIAWKDSSGAIANRILVGVLNEAAKLYDEGLASQVQIDKIFLETFYSKQIRIATKKAKNQFNSAPKLGFFTDEKYLYEKTRNCKDKEKKKVLLELAEGKLRQKVLYSQILENHADLGSFFSPAPCVAKLRSKALEQMKNIREAINNIDKPFDVKPYDFPREETCPAEGEARKWQHGKSPRQSCARNDKGLISDRLKAAYICISQRIYLEGLASIHDIEIACKEGFKWNVGPFEMSYILGEEKVIALSKLANHNLSGITGISAENEVVKVTEEDISGIQTYIQGDVAYIILGRLHIQNLQMMQNSLGLYTLKTLKKIISNYENSSIKTIIFKSQGGGAFCSGADLEYINNLNWDTEKILAYRNLGKGLMDLIASCKKITVAVVDGPAIGGGLELALACDYRIMTDQAFVAMPEVALGIIPDWGGTERLPAIIGKKLAKRMICTATLKNLGLKLSAEDAYAVGLADYFVLQSELPVFMFDLLNNKIPNIDIYKKANPKLHYEKSDYPEAVVKRFTLNSPFKHSSRWLTKHSAKFAEDLIDNSHDVSYAKRVDDDSAFIRLIRSGKIVSNTCIKPMLSFSQNKIIAPLLEKIGVL